MFDLPLHPAIVHLPLAGAVFVPLVAVFLVFGRGSRDTWLLGVGLQGLTLLGATLGLRTGEADEERVEHAVRESLIHAHEEAAELFTVILGLGLAVWVAGLLLRSDRLRRGLAVVAAVAGLLGLIAGLQVGHLGGELVYQHGAASAWVGGAAQGGGAGQGRGRGRGEEDEAENEDEDEDEQENENENENENQDEHRDQNRDE